jgi:hypothetical protein
MHITPLSQFFVTQMGTGACSAGAAGREACSASSAARARAVAAAAALSGLERAEERSSFSPDPKPWMRV